jgi:ATP-dependent Clp protease ATP-binding subunit ClpC
MTSNIGSRDIKDFGRGVGFNTSKTAAEENENTKYIIQKALKKAFAPEFLNRIDDVVMFNSLDKSQIHLIIDIEIADLYKRVEALNYKLLLTEEAKDFIADKGYDPQFGARPLKRAIQKYLEDEMAEIIIKASISEGDSISVEYDRDNDKLRYRIQKSGETIISN